MKVLLFCFLRAGCYLEGRLLFRDLLILLASVHMPFTAPKYWVLQSYCARVKSFTGKTFFKSKKYLFAKICCNSESLCSSKSKVSQYRHQLEKLHVSLLVYGLNVKMCYFQIVQQKVIQLNYVQRNFKMRFKNILIALFSAFCEIFAT